MWNALVLLWASLFRKHAGDLNLVHNILQRILKEKINDNQVEEESREEVRVLLE
jgi:hypothetical protein